MTPEGHNEIESKHNPKSVLEDEWEQMKFSDIDVNHLFWLQNFASNTNHAYRKQTDRTALNTKTREIHTFDGDTTIYDRY